MKSFFMHSVVALMILTGPALAQEATTPQDLNKALRINDDSRAALAALVDLADQGDSLAALFASEAYRGGFGAERNLDRAREFAVRAADLGSSGGFMLQGDLIRQQGGGSEEAIAQARPFWDQAVALANPSAMARVAEVDAPAVVVKVQEALAAKGFDAGVVDGLIGQKTLGALNNFCAQADIAEACTSGELTSLPVLRAITRAGLFKP